MVTLCPERERVYAAARPPIPQPTMMMLSCRDARRVGGGGGEDDGWDMAV